VLTKVIVHNATTLNHCIERSAICIRRATLTRQSIGWRDWRKFGFVYDFHGGGASIYHASKNET
jgi:hypothetical protein